MKKTVLAISIFAGLMMTACLPDSINEQFGIPEGALLLTTEGFTNHNSKTSVSGTSVQWVNGDKLDAYVGSGAKQECTVTVSESMAYTSSDVTVDDVIRAYYPAGITAGNETTNGPRIKIPAEYACSVSDGRQVIALPMVAKGESGATALEFKHVSAAVILKLKNSISEDLYVDSAIVVSENYQICTPSGVTLSNWNLEATPSTISGNRKVKVTFPGNDFVVPSGDANKSIQVPIRPIGADHLTIKVYCHSTDKEYVYSYRPDSPVAALGRNEVLTAGVDLNTAEHMEEVVEPVGRSINMSSVTSYPFTAQDGDTLYGTNTTYYTNKQCIIPDGVTVVFKGLTLGNATVKAEGNSTIKLEGTNSITGAYGRPAIFVASGNTLTIQGPGSLSATGGGNSAGIGCGPSGNGYAECGNIYITGGTITATGGSGAAGIGTGSNADNSCGNITIANTVTKVTATKGSGATASIGKGNAGSSCGTVTIGGTVGEITDSPYTYQPTK